ncbi:hypothetical protein [Flavobacterium sp. UBA7680]|uniref:hypothetical protein n=1 Tax=Flavobacterium sp. UBA7680 TaxID=1946559 RepID=UPI0025B87063|nr:hypothetical protein [Flavobacterium sp. UBA7680]
MSEKNFPGPIQIPLATAEVWEKRYEDDTTIETRENKVKSFLIPRESLEKVLALDTDAVRAYLGINDQKERTLLFVGAQYDKETGKYVDVYGKSSSEQNKAEAAEDIVYDGIRPSPPY